MYNWSFWDWIAYGCLGVAALGLAIGAVLKDYPALVESLPHFFMNPKWAYAPIILFVIGTIILIIRIAAPFSGNGATTSPPTEYVETRIRLERESGSDINFVSTKEREKNIYTWQQVYTHQEFRNLHSGKTDILHTDTFFIIFDKPINYMRPIIDAFGQKIPPYEFYLNSDRGIILMFKDTLAVPAFEVYFPPPAKK